ncbi:MAG TPA: SdpI family protein [Candidatus Limivicinus faecipullorum]|nr:SdpI family protein [Candidatus Limivicinus faecipullorum]
MGYWLYMLGVCLVIPLTMIIFGRHFMHSPPKEINGSYGYRTSMSMKSRETWDFAHRYFGRLWFILGLMLLPLSAAAMLFLLGESVKAIGNSSLIIMAFQLLFLIIPIFPTERALKKNFDQFGFRR